MVDKHHIYAVYVTKEWAGLNEVLSGALDVINQEHGYPTAYISAASVNLTDGYFAEVTIYPKVLEGEPFTLHIPKHHIVSIAKLESAKHAKAVGFRL